MKLRYRILWRLGCTHKSTIVYYSRTEWIVHIFVPRLKIVWKFQLLLNQSMASFERSLYQALSKLEFQENQLNIGVKQNE